ncbi:ATP synthase protein I [Rhodovulum imhoffii]|uniref:ATP synthase protein I n=1 Tax=Rhodovulum imhoffii TaxID=365340 RepID=A0A2T5BSC1_9RHOB|nr:AtpZ/AtpI family protein [Rhodovulum imhoffii]MBK5934717.1 F0F1 ATP synthase subunit I [Rhodovulum imhoffii]PTN02141.1 ATP synthase protein I [Rhodovulum imhoffii]
MIDPAEKERLARLERRISNLKKTDQAAAKAHQDEHYSQAQLAWRMVIELVAGLMIGFGIGYTLDLWMGTLPLFLVLFILLGFAAGVRVMMRSAKEAQAQQAAAAADETRD